MLVRTRSHSLLISTSTDVLRVHITIIGATQLNSSLLTISVIAVILPAAFHLVLSGTDDTAHTSNAVEGSDVFETESRCMSSYILLIVINLRHRLPGRHRPLVQFVHSLSMLAK